MSAFDKVPGDGQGNVEEHVLEGVEGALQLGKGRYRYSRINVQDIIENFGSTRSR